MQLLRAFLTEVHLKLGVPADPVQQETPKAQEPRHLDSLCISLGWDQGSDPITLKRRLCCLT